jgi:hypothetical protein
MDLPGVSAKALGQKLASRGYGIQKLDFDNVYEVIYEIKQYTYLHHRIELYPSEQSLGVSVKSSVRPMMLLLHVAGLVMAGIAAVDSWNAPYGLGKLTGPFIVVCNMLGLGLGVYLASNRMKRTLRSLDARNQ